MIPFSAYCAYLYRLSNTVENSTEHFQTLLSITLLKSYDIAALKLIFAGLARFQIVMQFIQKSRLPS